MRKPDLSGQRVPRGFIVLVYLFFSVAGMEGCARLPYTVTLVHEDRRVEVTLQREVNPSRYAHPVSLTSEEVASILKGFSIRPQKNMPTRWFAEEVPTKPVFREDEVLVLSGWLAAGLRAATPDERVHFALFAPGMNPSNERDVTAGWMAIRDRHLYVTVEYFHVQVPLRKSDQYDYNYPTPPPLFGAYLLYFEPGRFWLSDSNGERGLEYRQFLATTLPKMIGSP